jgi:hypothetical protein
VSRSQWQDYIPDIFSDGNLLTDITLHDCRFPISRFPIRREGITRLYFGLLGLADGPLRPVRILVFELQMRVNASVYDSKRTPTLSVSPVNNMKCEFRVQGRTTELPPLHDFRLWQLVLALPFAKVLALVYLFSVGERKANPAGFSTSIIHPLHYVTNLRQQTARWRAR